jgi:ubiquinone/menaquinone biosynthesis C-methylase UbiE
MPSLKADVKSHWEAETCGTRYGASQNRREFFENVSSARYRLEPYITTFARFPEGAGREVLEIGVGAGSDFENWTRHARHATGVDLTEGAIALTQERLGLAGVDSSRFTLKVADAEGLPFADSSFDLVYSWGVLHHSPDTRAAFREVARVLRPGGVFRVMVYHVPSWVGLMLYLNHGLARGKVAMTTREAIYQHLESPGTKAYTVEEGRELVVQAGMQPVAVYPKLSFGDLLDLDPSAKHRGRKFDIAKRLYPRRVVRALGDRFGLYLLIDGRKPESKY